MKPIAVFSLLILFISCKENQAKKESNDILFSNALACTFSEISYCTQPQDTLDKYLPGWKITWNPESINGNYAFVASKGEKHVIAIRGSVLAFNEDAFENWVKQDLHVAVQENWPYTDNADGAKVSQGAYDGWQNLVNLKDKQSGRSLKQFLDSAVTKEIPLLITGHSLGGNLATVFASWLDHEMKKENKQLKNLSIITFAAPAAGNTVFAADFDKRFPNAVRIENTNDIVPKFPVALAIDKLSELYSPSPAAKEIEIDFTLISFKLTRVFDVIKLSINGIEAVNGGSKYAQLKGSLINIPLSGKYNANTVENFFAEAGYQHSVEQYANAAGAPIIKTP
jgi:triacylglycerol lipase